MTDLIEAILIEIIATEIGAFMSSSDCADGLHRDAARAALLRLIEGGPYVPPELAALTVKALDFETPVLAKSMDFTPIKSDMKNFYFQLGREIAKERDQRTSLEKHAGIIAFVLFGILIVIFLYFYFQYANGLAAREFSCVSPEAAKKFVEALQAGAQVGPAAAPPEAAPNPFMGFLTS